MFDTSPIARGKTFYDGATIDTANYDGVGLEGRVVAFADRDPSVSGTAAVRSGSFAVYLIVRNVSGVALPKGRLVAWASGYTGKRVDSITRTTAQAAAGVVDDHIGSAGVPNGDLFLLCVKGPQLVKAPLTGAEHSVAAGIAVGDLLYALTQATSSMTNAISGGGRIVAWNGTFGDTHTTNGTMGNILVNKVGRAMSAITSGQTTDSSINVLTMLDMWPVPIG